MAQRPRLLDLYCGAGGAAMGYYKAGFDVVGVDIKPQKRYPFEFIQDDVIDYLRDASFTDLVPSLIPYSFDVIHASPPCQRHSMLNHTWKRDQPDLIFSTRKLLKETGLPYVIENVVGAPLINPVKLCGSYFFLGTKDRYLQRHRLFESNMPLLGAPCMHPKGQYAIGVYGKGKWDNNTSSSSDRRGGYQGTLEEKKEAMEIDWMTLREIAEAVPPAYTEYIGRQILDRFG